MNKTSRILFDKHFDGVETVNDQPPLDPTDPRAPKSFSVNPRWRGVDRPHVGGWGFSDTPRTRALAARLVQCIESGAAFSSVALERDVNGKTYVNATAELMGRHLDRDLRRLGY